MRRRRYWRERQLIYAWEGNLFFLFFTYPNLLNLAVQKASRMNSVLPLPHQRRKIMHLRARIRRTGLVTVSIVILSIALLPASAQSGSGNRPWMDTSLSPDERANMVLKEMTLDEKITLLHGTGMNGLGPVSPLSVGSNGGAGYVVGIPRLGIPSIQISDAAYGVRSSGENGRY